MSNGYTNDTNTVYKPPATQEYTRASGATSGLGQSQDQPSKTQQTSGGCTNDTQCPQGYYCNLPTKTCVPRPSQQTYTTPQQTTTTTPQATDNLYQSALEQACPAGQAWHPQQQRCIALTDPTWQTQNTGMPSTATPQSTAGTKSCTDDSQCPTGYRCYNYQCYPQDKIPVNPDPCAGVTCPTGQHCENGVCVPDAPATPETGDDETKWQCMIQCMKTSGWGSYKDCYEKCYGAVTNPLAGVGPGSRIECEAREGQWIQTGLTEDAGYCVGGTGGGTGTIPGTYTQAEIEAFKNNMQPWSGTQGMQNIGGINIPSTPSQPGWETIQALTGNNQYLPYMQQAAEQQPVTGLDQNLYQNILGAGSSMQPMQEGYLNTLQQLTGTQAPQQQIDVVNKLQQLMQSGASTAEIQPYLQQLQQIGGGITGDTQPFLQAMQQVSSVQPYTPEFEQALIKAKQEQIALSYAPAIEQIQQVVNDEAQKKGMYQSGARISTLGKELGDLGSQMAADIQSATNEILNKRYENVLAGLQTQLAGAQAGAGTVLEQAGQQAAITETGAQQVQQNIQTRIQNEIKQAEAAVQAGQMSQADYQNYLASQQQKQQAATAWSNATFGLNEQQIAQKELEIGANLRAGEMGLEEQGLLLQQQEYTRQALATWAQYDQSAKQMQLDAMLQNKTLEYENAIKRGELDIAQFQAELAQALGISEQELAARGVDLQVLTLLADYSITNARTATEREQVIAGIEKNYWAMNYSERNEWMALLQVLIGGTTGIFT